MSFKLLIPQEMKKEPHELNRYYAERVLEFNIVTLNLLPGQLISEHELAKALGISRTPVHEALIELSKKSLTTIIPQVGTKISLIDTKTVEAVCFLRFSTEIKILEKTYDTISPLGISALRRHVLLQKDASENSDYLQFLEYDNAFHMVLFKEADLEEVGFLLTPYMPVFNRVRMLIYKNLDIPRIIHEHSALVDCLENRDREGAVDILTKHLSYDVLHDVNLLKGKFPHYFFDPSSKELCNV